MLIVLYIVTGVTVLGTISCVCYRYHNNNDFENLQEELDFSGDENNVAL